ILEEEEELLSSQKDSALENPIHHGSRDRTSTDGDRYRPINVVDFMNSAQDDLNLQSCLHFIIDLYAHWLAGGPDSVPLPLLSATVDSVVLLSDLFTERKQYVWCKEKLTLIHQNRGTTFDDELVMQHTVLSVLRSIAVLGNTGNDSEKETNALIETGLRQVQLSVRISTLRGVLYYLQTLTSDEAVTLMPILSEYILSSLSIYALFDGENVVLDKPQSLDHQLICWAIAFFIIGSFHDPHTKQSFAPKFIEICLKALLNKNAPFIIFEAVCVGIENLFSSSNIESKFIKHLIDFSTNCIKNSRCAKTTLLVVRILIACLYNVKSSQLSIESHSPDFETPRNIMEPAVSAMEKLSLLMYKVSNGSLVEAQILSSLLPIYLVDNFNPGDVMNRIIGELLQFPHHYPKLIMKVLLSIIKALLDREAKEVVLEWLLLSLPSFTHRKPWFYARWCLTSLFLYSSSNDFVSRIYKIASDDGRQDSVGHRLFLLACDAFKSQLKGSTQLESFEQMIKLTLQRNGV
uniref:Huntingtin n=1 Tax=Romanomermis culicivorax TaxID=13658 RepID=A0A915IES9_ROMCU